MWRASRFRHSPWLSTPCRRYGPASGIEVQVSGFDNTRTISQATFTFVQRDGTTIAPGAIRQDLAVMFKDYFAGAVLGGAFQMKANFPIAGNGALIDGVRITMTNSVGQTSWPAGESR